jgi:hypothetical protein
VDIHHALRELRNRVQLGPQVFATNLGLSTRSISKYDPAHTPGARPVERCAIGNFPACALPNLLPLVFRSLASKCTESRRISTAFWYKSAKIVSAHPQQVMIEVCDRYPECNHRSHECGQPAAHGCTPETSDASSSAFLARSFQRSVTASLCNATPLSA